VAVEVADLVAGREAAAMGLRANSQPASATVNVRAAGIVSPDHGRITVANRGSGRSRRTVEAEQLDTKAAPGSERTATSACVSARRAGAVLLVLHLSVLGASAQSNPGARCGAGVLLSEADGLYMLPEGGLFCPLAADPKAEHSYLSYLRGDFPELTALEEDTNVGSVGIGDHFPLMRWAARRPGNGVQLGLTGGVFAQFDLHSASFDLINADYVIGLPLTTRWGGFTARLKLYHQSSHLGDEFLLRGGDTQRENLSFESLELLLSQEIGWFRLYAGGEYMLRGEPDTLEDWLAHGGLELRVGDSRAPHLLLAGDVKSAEQQDWDPGISARGGLELALWREHGHPPRVLGVLFEYYTGPSPYGQFFQNDVTFFGIGMHFSL
jgi:hypothetical protein